MSNSTPSREPFINTTMRLAESMPSRLSSTKPTAASLSHSINFRCSRTASAVPNENAGCSLRIAIRPLQYSTKSPYWLFNAQSMALYSSGMLYVFFSPRFERYISSPQKMKGTPCEVNTPKCASLAILMRSSSEASGDRCSRRSRRLWSSWQVT